MRVDMHLHTFRSIDGMITPREIKHALESGKVDAVAITDHNTVRAWSDFEGLNVIKGIEKTVEEEDGNEFHVLVYFMNEEIRSRNFFEVVDAAREQDAFISIAHPFDHLRKSPSDMGKYYRYIDAVECFNSRIRIPNANAKAEAFAKEKGLLRTAGSDSHHRFEIGSAYVECRAGSIEEFRKMLQKGEVEVKGRTTPFYLHIFTHLKRLGIVRPTVEDSFKKTSHFK